MPTKFMEEKLPLITGKLQYHSGKSWPGRTYPKEVFQRAVDKYAKERGIDLQGMIKQKADEIATKWESEFKEEKK